MSRRVVVCSALIASLGLAACSGSGSSSDTATQVTQAPTTTVAEVVYPLTGLPVEIGRAHV